MDDVCWAMNPEKQKHSDELDLDDLYFSGLITSGCNKTI